MATIGEYLTAQKQARMSIETVNRRIRQAYDLAQATTNDGTYDDLERLVDDGARQTFVNTLVNNLSECLTETIDGTPETRIIAEALAMDGFYGFTRENVTAFVSSAKGSTNFEGFMKYLNNSDYTHYQDKIELRARAHLPILDGISTRDVLSYVGITDTSHIVMDRVDLRAKAELMGTFEQYGAIPKKWLESKPYWSTLVLPGGIVTPR